MPTKEIRELRLAGKLEEALLIAKAELLADPENIWSKRNLSWVYYDYLKKYNSADEYEQFFANILEIKNLELPVDEKMLFEKLCWQVGKMAFNLARGNETQQESGVHFFEAIQSFHFPCPSDGYSFLFKAFHKLLKETTIYLQFADWWDFRNFQPIDFQKEVLTNGQEVMAIAEQAYIAYSKHLLPKHSQDGRLVFDNAKVLAFLPALSNITEQYPQFLYPAYFHAKLLLALGENENLLEPLLPFARKKRNDFWVWEIFAEAFQNDSAKVFACYCKALSCKSPEEMLVGLRQKFARLLISQNLFNEARTEIDLLVQSRINHGFKIPEEVMNWKSLEWYKSATSSKSNFGFYKKHLHLAEALLYSDIPEELIIVDFVNKDKKMLNFIVSESKFGFFKYDRFFSDVKIGDTLQVRFQSGNKEGLYQLFTAVKHNDESIRNRFVKQVTGIIRIPTGKNFGFIDDVFIHPNIVSKFKLTDGINYVGEAIKTYNKEKKQWGWKLF